jgi:hypothetical protein
VRFVINKKYRFTKDCADPTVGKIPQGMTATFICSAAGNAKFKLPNGKQIGIPEKSAPTVLEELR